MPGLRERMLALLLAGVMLMGTAYVPHHHHAQALCLHDEPTSQAIECDCQASHEACPTDCAAVHRDAPQAQADDDKSLDQPTLASPCATSGHLHTRQPAAAAKSLFSTPSFHSQQFARRGGLRAPPVFRIA